MRMLEDIPNREVYKLGIAYISTMTIIAAVSNYFTWHRQFSSTAVETAVFIFCIMIWIALYIPVYIFTKKAEWKIEDFGFVLNKRLLAVSLVLVSLISIRLLNGFPIIFNFMVLLEAFSRTGEELFYRGFVYTFILRLSKGKESPWKWAVLYSSVLFAIMHTQTFLPDNSLRIWDIFISALILALLRHWTGSILPGVIVHCATNGGIICMFAGILIYGLFITVNQLISKRRGNFNEDTLFNNEESEKQTP